MTNIANGMRAVVEEFGQEIIDQAAIKQFHLLAPETLHSAMDQAKELEGSNKFRDYVMNQRSQSGPAHER